MHREAIAGSKNVKSAGYDEQQKQMHVEFAGGMVYVYNDVEPETYRQFQKAKSKGSFIHTDLRKHKYEKLEKKEKGKKDD